MADEHDLGNLIRSLQAAANGSEPSDDEIRAIRWQSSDDVIDQAASDAWNRLRQFVADDDLRSRDRDYDSQMRSGLRWRAEELVALAAGNDPLGRRNSFVSRIRRWLSARRHT
jgi:hypothetical protein